MADLEKTFPQESGLTLYCFPDQRYDDVSLDDWDDLAVEAEEQAAPNLGRYDVTLDDTYRYWLVFEGATQPGDWNQWVDVIDVTERGVLSDQDVEEIRYRLGLSGQATAPSPQNSPSVLTIPPGNLAERIATGYTVCVNKEGGIEEGITVSIQMIAGPGDAGYSYNTPVRRLLSDEDGLVTFEGMIRGATYSVWRGRTATSARKKTVVVPDEDVFELPETL